MEPGAQDAASLEEQLRPIAAAFAGGAQIAGAEPLGRGLIHGTWSVRVEEAGATRELVVQRLNTDVFGDPLRLMENVVRVTEHLRAKLEAEAVPDPGRHCLQVVFTVSGEPCHRDGSGGFWRAFERIEGAVSFQRPSGPEQAAEAARAFASFARRLADLPPPPLHETLPGFHDFSARLDALERAAASDTHGRARDVRAELEALDARCRQISAALDATGFARLPRRVVHHDCKLDNLLFDAAGRRALCVVDLDTVMPGTLLSDFGELVRSSTNTAKEDEPELAQVDFDRELYAALAQGYLEGAGLLLTEAERHALPLAGPLLTLMNAVRFLTDHLQGDRYFRIERPGHNLSRTRVHLQLASGMLENEDALRAPF